MKKILFIGLMVGAHFLQAVNDGTISGVVAQIPLGLGAAFGLGFAVDQAIQAARIDNSVLKICEQDQKLYKMGKMAHVQSLKNAVINSVLLGGITLLASDALGFAKYKERNLATWIFPRVQGNIAAFGTNCIGGVLAAGVIGLPWYLHKQDAASRLNLALTFNIARGTTGFSVGYTK